MRYIRKNTKFWFISLMERVHAEELAVDGRTVLKWVLEK
jgi:hypothetical protein